MSARWDIEAEFVSVEPKRAADGSIDEDVGCFSCWYNLRGLKGEDVTCPECGYVNKSDGVLASASAMRDAVNALEVTPIGCAVFGAFSALSFFLCWPMRGTGGALFFGAVGIALVGVWVATVRHTGRLYGWKEGWKVNLAQYHVVCALYTAFLPVGILTIVFELPAGVLWRVFDTKVAWSPLSAFGFWAAASGLCLLAAVLLHRRARRLHLKLRWRKALHLAWLNTKKEEKMRS